MPAFGNKRIALSFNSPAVLCFAAACAAAQIVGALAPRAALAVFSVYRSSLLDPLTYVRCVCHVFGHADLSHLIGNMMYILILGPMIEEKYGTRNTALVILASAAATGIANMLLFPGVRLMGASGVAFAFILMASITVKEDRTIPVTFILVALLYIGQQVQQGLFTKDNVSQTAHIVGGAVGTLMGFSLSRAKKSGYR